MSDWGTLDLTLRVFRYECGILEFCGFELACEMAYSNLNSRYTRRGTVKRDALAMAWYRMDDVLSGEGCLVNAMAGNRGLRLGYWRPA